MIAEDEMPLETVMPQNDSNHILLVLYKRNPCILGYKAYLWTDINKMRINPKTAIDFGSHG